jgi:predicted dehydrogenase
MSSPPTRVAVLGVGHLGRHHARILGELPEAELVAVVDPDEARGRELADLNRCRWQPTAEGLADEVEAAVVAVPTTLHLKVAGPLLAAGVACLVEKPLAPDPATCRALVEAARDGGALLGTGHVERFNPAVRRAMELGIRPRFIEAHRLAPYTFRSADVGVVLDLMIHDIDLALAWTGSEVVEVDAVGGASLSPAEDICSARLRFADGAVANLTASRLSLKAMRRFRIFGPDCYLSVDSQDRQALLVRKAAGFSTEAVAEAAASTDPVAGFKGLLDVEELTIGADEPLRAELQAFLAGVRGDAPLPVSGEDGMRAVEVAFRIMEALEASSWSLEDEPAARP